MPTLILLFIILSIIAITVSVIIKVMRTKTQRVRDQFIDDYQNLLASVVATPLTDVRRAVETMLADPTQYAVLTGGKLDEKDASRLSPLLRDFFQRFAEVKWQAQDVHLTRASLFEPAPEGLILLGRDHFDQALIYAVDGSETIALRGDGYEYALDLPSIYHYLYFVELLRKTHSDA